MSTLPGKVAVIGTGDIGCGWAALGAAAGWPVWVFDANARAVEQAFTEVPRRARAIVAMGRAAPGIVERGLLELQQGRSLLQAVQGADWVIEAIHEDVLAKQKLFEAIEQVAAPDALLSSSSSGLVPTEIFGRCRRLDRCLVTHPLHPPELIPLVEIVPEGRTSAAAVQRARGYVLALGRIPVVLKRAVPGFVVGRIAAAVWRESIDLVLSGVIDVEDLDRAVSLGPALGWAAAGPHLTYHLGAGEGGVPVFLHRLLNTFEGWWGGLATWQKLDPERQRALIQAIQKTYAGRVEVLREGRDRTLGAILKAVTT
ncbi:MAG: 3-hydroxyacyl-CoA dehydrogenase family protein [Gemmatimonadales bacterium]